MKQNPINPDHDNKRRAVRALGKVMLTAGILLTAIGLISFFSSFNSFGGPPKYFWCAFIGLPLTGIGASLMKFGYLGAIARYVAEESAPVAKDTFNYLAEGTRDGVRTVAGAVSEGLNQGLEKDAAPTCPSCGTPNDADASFCDHCGNKLLRPCPSCHRENDADARFCDGCGAHL